MSGKEALTRRSFLRSAALTGGSALALGLMKTVHFARELKTDSPVASTKFGKVRGYIDNEIKVFKGIRYGADTSTRRFMPALPPEPWLDIRDAIEYGP
jgi:para-nitrobenzyl esterase